MHMDATKLSGIGRRLFNIIEFDENEQLKYEIRKHPFGLLVIYFTGLFVAGAIFLLLVVAPAFVAGDPVDIGFDLTNAKVILASLGGLLTVLAIIGTAIGAYLYQSNVVLVTSEKLAQVLYRTIFDRKISQLSIGDVQDVTVTQVGIFARIFNYGTLVVETAGEQQNYTFTYTPNPYIAAKAIVEAHEENLKQYGN
jgi:ABC-type multidrug transport system fused ATPase/permease subunit